MIPLTPEQKQELTNMFRNKTFWSADFKTEMADWWLSQIEQLEFNPREVTDEEILSKMSELADKYKGELMEGALCAKGMAIWMREQIKSKL